MKSVRPIYRDMGDYTQAPGYCREALKLNEELNQKDIAAARLQVIAGLHKGQ